KPHLDILPAGQHDPIDAVLDYVWALPHGQADFVTMVIPELFRRPSLLAAIRCRTIFRLKLKLLAEPGLVVTDVRRLVEQAAREPGEPERSACFVPISGVNAASLRALRYAELLGLPETTGLFFAFDDEEAERVRDDWRRFGLRLPLEVVEPT